MKKTIFLLLLFSLITTACSDKDDEPVVTSIQLQPIDTDIYIGQSYQFEVTHQPANATKPQYTWESSDTTIINVDNQGKITTKKLGDATITVKANKLGLSSTQNIRVNNKTTGIELISPEKDIIIGDEYQFAVKHTPINSKTPQYTWQSSDTNIAQIDNNGKLKALTVGQVTITVKSLEFDLTSYLTINIQPILATSIEINKQTIELLPNQKENLTYVVKPSNTTNTQVRWQSSKTQVAVVSAEGNITGIAEGTALITASIDQVSTTCSVTVPKTLFGYKWGISIEKVNPEIKLNNNLAYNTASSDHKTPIRAFVFNQNQLAAIWSSYDIDGFVSQAPNYFLKEVNALNPPKAITLEYDSYIGRFAKVSAASDSLTWKYGDYTILVRNGTIFIDNHDRPQLIIEYIYK